MFTVIGCMLTGIGAGILLRRFDLGWINKIVIVTIWLLLYLLGLDIGGNPKIISALPTLGLTALIISVTATFGSCLAAAAMATTRPPLSRHSMAALPMESVTRRARRVNERTSA